MTGSPYSARSARGGLALQPEVDQAKVEEAVQAAYRTFGQSFAGPLFFDEPFFNGGA